MVITPDWELVGYVFKNKNYCFWKEKPRLISPILNSKYKKTQLMKLLLPIGIPLVHGIIFFTEFVLRDNFCRSVVLKTLKVFNDNVLVQSI